MDIQADYRRRAAECEQLAESAITEEHRQTILKIAETWRSLAEQRERVGLAQADASGTGGVRRTPRGKPRS